MAIHAYSVFLYVLNMVFHSMQIMLFILIRRDVLKDSDSLKNLSRVAGHTGIQNINHMVMAVVSD